MQVFRVSFVTLFLVCLGQCEETDYCDEKLCPPNLVHIACKNDKSFGKACAKNAEVIIPSELLQKNMFYLHNMLRNTLAGGFLNNLPPAGRMATMVWDPELAYLAELNVKQCQMEYDQCHSTKNFPYPGQNLAFSSFKGYDFEVEVTTLRQINMWFNGFANISVEQINAYSIQDNNTRIKQFLQVTQEKATHFGCAILRQTSKRSTQQYLACNYAIKNMLSQPVYTIAAKGGANCKTGHHHKYEYLCSTDEKYD